MSKNLTYRQYSTLLINSFIGLGILSLASETAIIAKNNNYITVFIAGIISTTFTLFTSAYIFSKTSLNFMEILKKLYGKVIYRIIYLLFLLNFFIVESLVISQYATILHMNISSFIPSMLLIILVLLISSFTSNNTISTLGKLSELNSITLISLILLPIIYLPKLEIINIKPFFNNLWEISYALPSCILAYQGGEHSFFFIESINDRKNLIKINLICSIYIIFIYTIVTLSSTGYMGAELISKIKYSLILLVELMNLPIIGDLKVFFLIIWSAAILITISSNQYIIINGLKNLIHLKHKISNVLLNLFIFILLLVFSALQTYYPKLYANINNIFFPILYALILFFCILTFILFYFNRRKLYE